MDNNLPPGFELEQPAQSTSSSSGLPPGFELEQSNQSNEARADIAAKRDAALQAKFGTPSQQAIAGAEAVGRAATFGGSTYLEKVAGISPESIEGREEANPMASGVGTIGGLLVPGAPEAKVLTGAGKLAVKGVSKVAPKIVGEGILAGASRGAVKVATENALYQAGDENHKMIMNDPEQTFGSAVSNIGLAAVIGAGAGGILGTVSPLWRATAGDKASQLAADFKGRLHEHANDPDRVGTFTSELGDYYKNTKQAADEVYGSQGIKGQVISKNLPEEIAPKVSQQLEDLTSKSEQALKNMVTKQVPERFMNKFVNDVNTLHEAITKPESSSGDIFNAVQDFKQTLQGYSKGNYGPFAVPSYHEAYDFLNITKKLGMDARTALEDKSVWGKAADAQLKINKAFKEYLPALQDFERKFTSEIGGERVIDPGKANTYFNQLGKPSAELKQSMLKNFLNSSDKYRGIISDVHSELGTENPVKNSSTNMLYNTLKEQTHGAKLADMFVKKVGDPSGKLLGGAIGALAGAMSHIPGAGWLGGLLGERTLGPFIASVLPALAKPLLEKEAVGAGLKAATDYIYNAIKGAKLANDAIAGLFKAGSKILPDSKRPTKEDREKLEKSLTNLQHDPARIAGTDSMLGHYMPDHSAASGSGIMNIVSMLSSLKPQNQPRAMLDAEKPVSEPIKAQYNRVLDIANQPLIVIESIKEGTVNSNDVLALQKLYPRLYEGLKQKMINHIVENKGEGLSYQTKLGMSIFMGQPLDSTMNPDSIMAAQPAQQPQASRKMSQTAGSHLIKGAKSLQTATQASEAMHASGAKA